MIAFVASGSLAKVLSVRRPISWAIVVTFGAIVAATLTPLRGVFNVESIATGTCDMSRMGLAPLGELYRLDDTTLNVALFVPLGMAVGFVRAPRPRAALILASVALPFGIEATQFLAPILDRGCQSADVVDNLTGFLLGLGIATAATFVRSGRRKRKGVGRSLTHADPQNPNA
jgi:glycopeptide antibiotics resistance protein